MRHVWVAGSGADCVYLRGAAEALPGGSLGGSWVPSCTAEGAFHPTQCDQVHCWCVDAKGAEIPGTKFPVQAAQSCNRLILLWPFI